MRKNLGCLFLASLLTAAVCQGSIIQWSATLTGPQEVPRVTTPASGTAMGTYDTQSNRITYHIMYADLSAPETMAHFHVGRPGQPGPVIVTLPLGTPKDGTAVIPQQYEASLLADNIYVNVHSQTHPAGEIRGQVVMGSEIPEPASVLSSASGLLFAAIALCVRRRRKTT